MTTTDSTTETTPTASQPSLLAEYQEAARAVWGDAPSESAKPDAPAATPEPAKAEEPPKTEPETPASARIAAAKRAQAKADSQRRAAEAQARELQARASQLEAQAKAQQEREDRLRLMEEDPAAYFAAKSPADVRAHLERLAAGAKPEDITAKKQAQLEEEVKRLRAETEAREEAARAAQMEAERARARSEGGAAFTAHVSEHIDKYQFLIQEYPTPDEAVNAGLAALEEVIGTDRQGRRVTRVAAFIADQGRPPNNDEIAEYLDQLAKARIESRKQNAWRPRGEKAPESASAANGTAVTKAPTVNPGTHPRTLSARDTGQRSAAAPNVWTQEAADEQSLRILEQMYRK